MAVGPGMTMGNAFGSPGTSGSLASIFSDQARVYQMDREKEEELDAERSQSKMDAVTNTGSMAIKQAEFAGKSRDLQQAKLKGLVKDDVAGADQFQNIDPVSRDKWDIAGKAKDTFSTQGIEAVPGSQGANATPAAKQLGMKSTPAVQNISSGDVADKLDNVMNPPPVGTTGLDAAAKGGVKSALGNGMNIAGGVAGVAGAVGGANKMMKSETTTGKIGGALGVAGGLGSAAMAAGLLSGPLGWGAMGASLLGGFLND